MLKRIASSLAGPRARRALSFAGFCYVVWAFLNGSVFVRYWPELHVEHVLLGPQSEILAILVFGLFTIPAERNPYTRRRLIALWLFMATMWGAIPAFFPFPEPYVGHPPFAPRFPGVHYPGALSYFLWLLLIFLFGRRVDCGWCCPCVAIRETVGAPFRDATPRGATAWKLRHVQWLVLAAHVAYVVLIFVPPTAAGTEFFRWFWRLVPFGYFLSFLVVPFTGNRNFCRYLCPYGTLYGLVGTLGFFRIAAQPDKCVACGKCDRDCDMGVPVSELVRTRGEVRVWECVGCGRCVTGCPTHALEFRDVRDALRGRGPGR